LISSQVSTIAPEHAGRWDKTRRLNTALKLVAKHQPSRLITHRIPIDRAIEAYQLLDRQPDETVQVVLTY
jgi:threonine dehydrogenase-like Zn-dependent dehydrogenase